MPGVTDAITAGTGRRVSPVVAAEVGPHPAPETILPVADHAVWGILIGTGLVLIAVGVAAYELTDGRARRLAGALPRATGSSG